MQEGNLVHDRVNLLSVGESQRVPALDLSRLDFLSLLLFYACCQMLLILSLIASFFLISILGIVACIFSR